MPVITILPKEFFNLTSEKIDINGSTAYGFEYDYFLKDHLAIQEWC